MKWVSFPVSVGYRGWGKKKKGRPKWTNKTTCLRVALLTGFYQFCSLIRLIMHPECCLATRLTDHGAVHVTACLLVLFAPDTSRLVMEIDCIGKEELYFVKIPFLVKARAINTNNAANDACFIRVCTSGFHQKSSGSSTTGATAPLLRMRSNDFCNEDILHILRPRSEK